MTDPATNNIVLTHIGSALAAVGFIQWLKSFKWVQQAMKLVTRTISVLAAFAVHIGIVFTWTPAPSGGWNFAAFIPSFSVLLIAAYHVLLQYFYNETAYQGFQAAQSLRTLAKAAPKG